MTRPRVPARAALALGAGFLVALSMPPWGWWPLAFIGIALFEVSLGETPSRGERAGRAWLFGAGWFLPALGWMWYLTAPGYLVAVVVFAGLHSLAALAAPTGPWRILARPAAHTLVESIRLFFPFGGVPLATLAIGQAGGPLLDVARIGGVILLTWVVFQIGFALASRQIHGAATLGAVVLVIVVAAIAPSGSGTGRSTTLALVQGGGPQGTRASETRARDVVERHLAATRTIEPGTADVVVWPENVIDVAAFEGSVEHEEVAAEAARLGVPVLVGITEDAPDRERRFLNAQVVVTPDGEITSRFDKVIRVPFGEYVPLRGLLEAFGAPTDQVPTDAVSGDGPAVLDLPDGTRFGVVISWEVFFGRRARDGVDSGGELIINPTNGSSYTGTILQTQQVASSRLRAVETGRWVAQVSPTGFSAFVSPDGDVHDRTGVSERAVLVRDVELRDGRTWYTVYGDWPLIVLVAGALATAIVMSRRARPPAAP